MVSLGANVNACYSREDSRPVLTYLLKNKQSSLADWLLDNGAQPNCLLRWQFVVTDHVLTPNQILPIFEKHHVNIAIKSDDGISYNLMHYMCYFGLIDGVKMLAESPESQAFLNDPTEESDIALTITLLSPETTVDVKETIAAYLYKSSNIAICNKASQNPIQLVLLMGKIDLLLHMLNFNPTVRYDSFGNSYLHLAIKAGLPTVARFILHYTNVGDINKKDCKGDTVLTLAIKSGDEELACEILQYDKTVDVSITGVDWNLPNCEKDLVIHQTLKRNMPQLANAVCDSGDFFLMRDTQGNLPIHLALRYQLNSCIDFMLSRDVSSFINAPNDSDLDTPLLLSIKLGYYEQSLRILNCGGDVNFANRLGLTATHVIVKAAMGDYAQMAQETMNHDQLLYLMQEILNHRPNVMALCKNTDDCHSETSLHMAIRGGTQTEDLALILLAYCRDLVTIRDYDGCTPLIRAVESRSLRLVKALCVNQSELHVVNAAHDSPLHIAVANRDIEIIQYLVNHGAYLRIWNAEGYYPIHVAIRNKDLAALRTLCLSEVDANLITRDGLTCFLLACTVGSYECAAFLLDLGADPYLLDKNERSCLEIVTDVVRSKPDSPDYYAISYLVCGINDILSRECFSHCRTVDTNVMYLQGYINKGVASGLFHSEDVTVVPHDMACIYEPNMDDDDVVYPTVTLPSPPQNSYFPPKQSEPSYLPADKTLPSSPLSPVPNTQPSYPSSTLHSGFAPSSTPPPPPSHPPMSQSSSPRSSPQPSLPQSPPKMPQSPPKMPPQVPPSMPPMSLDMDDLENEPTPVEPENLQE